MKSNKILIVQTPAFHRNRGGVQRITFNLGKFFFESGMNVHYYSFEKEGHEEVQFGVLHHSLENGAAKNNRNIRHLDSVLDCIRADYVVNQMPYVKPLRDLLAVRKSNYGFKLIGCIHNSLFNFWSNAREVVIRTIPKPMNRVLSTSPGIMCIKAFHKLKHARDLKRIIDKHDRLLLYTPPNHDELKFFIGNYKPDKISYMPNPVHEITGPDEGKEKVIVHVGRITIAQKRSDLLLDFWEALYKDLPDWKFFIVGDGPYFDELKNDLKKRRIPRVFLEGFQKPEKYYRQAALFMMPSAFEGFPNTIIEAQSYGCPILAFDSYAALRWIVNDGKDALLSEPFDTLSLAQKTVKVVSDVEKLKEMQHAARENIKRFTITQIGQQWLELFKEIS